MERSQALDTIDKTLAGFDEERMAEEFSAEFVGHMKAVSYKRTMDVIVDFVELIRGRTGLQSGRVLDVGCGFGLHTIAWALLGYEAVGVDYSEPRFEVANKLNKLFHAYPFEVKLGNSAGVEIEDESFDLVYCNEMVSHVFDLEGMLREMHRVLKKGGQMFICDCSSFSMDYFKLRYRILPRDYEPAYIPQRKMLLLEHARKRQADLDDAMAEKLARNTRGWASAELDTMVERYAQGERSVKKLKKLHKPKFPFRDPYTGMYEERCFTSWQMGRIMRQQGFSKVRHEPMVPLPSLRPFNPNTCHNWVGACISKVGASLSSKYVVVGTK